MLHFKYETMHFNNAANDFRNRFMVNCAKWGTDILRNGVVVNIHCMLEEDFIRLNEIAKEVGLRYYRSGFVDVTDNDLAEKMKREYEENFVLNKMAGDIWLNY